MCSNVSIHPKCCTSCMLRELTLCLPKVALQGEGSTGELMDGTSLLDGSVDLPQGMPKVCFPLERLPYESSSMLSG